MSSAYYIVLEAGGLTDDIFVDGKTVARHCDKIGDIAEKNGLPRPEHYVSMPRQDCIDLLQDELEVQPDQKTIDAIPEETWFDAQEGLKYIQSLLSLFKEESCINTNTRKEIICGLEELINPFEYLQKENSRWHFQIDL